jgi:hypothetical protein
MLQIFRYLAVIMFGCSLALPARAVSSAWDGTWKLNPDKSQLTGSTYSLTQSANIYHYKGNGVEFDFACDGKDYPLPGGETISCQETQNVLKSTIKRNGTVVQRIERQLAPNAKMYHMVRDSVRPDGKTTTESVTYTRVGPGNGFLGTWRITAASSDTPDTMVIKTQGDSMHVEHPFFQLAWDGKLDGTPAPLKGETAPQGAMIAEKEESSKIAGTETMDGKPTLQWEDTLSKDGKSFTRMSWYPDHPDEKQTLVFDKQ